MDTARLSITIPKEIYQEIRLLASVRKIRLSHLITEAVRDKLAKIRQDASVRNVKPEGSSPNNIMRSATDILKYAPGHRLFKSATDADNYLKEERNAILPASGFCLS